MAEIKHERQYTTQAELDQMERELTEAEETLATRSGSRRKHKVKAGTVVFIIALACVLLLLGKVWIDKSAGRVPELFVYKIFQVETGSMEPTLPVGTIIVSQTPEHPEDLQEGTIVTFRQDDGTIVTHRIIEVIDGDGTVLYRTKGDNPVNSPDPELLRPENIEAVFRFSLNGGTEQ